MKVMALIPARGGSKGLPGKNVMPLMGKPMIAYSVEAALGAGLEPVVSTDDEEIARVARDAGASVPFMRPERLATDEATTLEVVFHALDRLYDASEQEDVLVCLLQPTSPLRSAEDIKGALALAREVEAPVVSVSPVKKPPSWMVRMDASGRLSPFVEDRQPGGVTRRQDAAPLYMYNGAIYVIMASALRQLKSFAPEGVVGYVMPAERSVDVDDLLDFRLAQAWLESQALK